MIERLNQWRGGDSDDLTDRCRAARYGCLMTDLPAPIVLVAIDPDRNIRRRYSVRADLNLFGEIEVETAWGRIGTLGQSKVERFSTIEASAQYVRRVLGRRKTAPRRLGVAYRCLKEPRGGM